MQFFICRENIFHEGYFQNSVSFNFKLTVFKGEVLISSQVVHTHTYNLQSNFVFFIIFGYAGSYVTNENM